MYAVSKFQNRARALSLLAVMACLSVMALPARATATVFDPLVTAVSFTDVIAALFGVALVLVAVVVTIKGISWVINMVKSKG